MAKLKKTTAPSEAPKPPVFQAPPPYVAKTPISDEDRKKVYETGLRHWQQEAEHYGYEAEKPEHVTRKLQAILGAPDREKTVEALEKAKETIQIAILSAWANGRIEGPVSVRSLETKIKKAESLAVMLKEKGLIDQAHSQIERAARLRDQLEDLKAQEGPK